MVTLRPRLSKKQEPQDSPVHKKKHQEVSFSLPRNEKASKKRSWWSSTNESGFPVGMMFTPTETELVGYYLNSRIDDKNFRADFVIECLNFYETEPWVIWEKYADVESNKGNRTLYFFARRRWMSGSSSRFDRRVGSGTWSGQYVRDVYDAEDEDGEAIGVRREFRYEGSREKDQNRAWLLKEYQIDEEDAIVLCALKRNPRQMSPMAKNTRSPSCVQKRKIKADRPRMKRCKVEESSDEEEEEQDVIVDVPKTEENPLVELAEDNSMMQAMVPFGELNGYEDCYCPELCIVDKPGSVTTEELLAQYSAYCDGSNLMNLVSTEERTMDFISMLDRL